MKHRITLVVLLIVIALGVPIIAGQTEEEWPTFRRDWARTGLASIDILSELEVIWKFSSELVDIKSSPAVGENKVYFTGVGKDGYLYIYALDVKSGSVMWKYRGNRDAGGGRHPSPTLADGTIYVGDENYLYAFDAETGEVKWRFEVPWPRKGLHGVDSAPVVVNNRIYFGSWDGWFYCVDVNTGELIWEYSDGVGAMGHVTEAPAFVNDIVYFGTAAGGVGYTGWVYALDADNGNLIWKFHIGDEITTSPVVVDNVLYIGAGFMGDLSGDGVWALDARTGELLWHFDTENVMITNSPVVVDGKVIFGSRYNNCIYALDARDGSVVWSTFIDETWFYSSPAVADGKVIIGAGSKLCMLNVENGSIIWSYDTVNVISSSPAVAYNRVYVGSTHGTLYCFGPPPEQPTSLQLDLPVILILGILICAAAGVMSFFRKRSAAKGFGVPPPKEPGTW